MHENIKAIRQALNEMSIGFSPVEGFDDALITKDYVFIRATTPFNDESISALCKDKAAVYSLLKGAVPMPKTAIVFDNKRELPLDILYPCIVKMNSGERGHNVYMVSNKEEVQLSLNHIFNKDSRNYDYIALIQECIKPIHEIRVVVSDSAVTFAYDRATAEIFSSEKLNRLVTLSETILKKLKLSWGALDFIESESGELFFLEVNTRPSFDMFISKNGNRLLVDAYKSSLAKLLKQ